MRLFFCMALMLFVGCAKNVPDMTVTPISFHEAKVFHTLVTGDGNIDLPLIAVLSPDGGLVGFANGWNERTSTAVAHLIMRNDARQNENLIMPVGSLPAISKSHPRIVALTISDGCPPCDELSGFLSEMHPGKFHILELQAKN